MVEQFIQKIARKIWKSEYSISIERIVLYGSYARGTQKGSSDVDLAIFLDEDSPYPILDDEGCPEGIFDYIKRIPSPKPVHAVVYKPSELEEALQSSLGDNLNSADKPLLNINQEGITLFKNRVEE